MDLIQLLGIAIICICLGFLYLVMRQPKTDAALRRMGTYGERVARHGRRPRPGPRIR